MILEQGFTMAFQRIGRLTKEPASFDHYIKDRWESEFPKRRNITGERHYRPYVAKVMCLQQGYHLAVCRFVQVRTPSGNTAATRIINNHRGIVRSPHSVWQEYYKPASRSERGAN